MGVGAGSKGDGQSDFFYSAEEADPTPPPRPLLSVSRQGPAPATKATTLVGQAAPGLDTHPGPKAKTPTVATYQP